MQKPGKIPEDLHEIAVFEELIDEKEKNEQSTGICIAIILLIPFTILTISYLWILRSPYFWPNFITIVIFFVVYLIFLKLFPIISQIGDIAPYTINKVVLPKKKIINSKITCYKEGILFLDIQDPEDEYQDFNYLMNKNNCNFIIWEDLGEISLSKDELGFQIFFSSKNLKSSVTYNLGKLKAKYIYPKEIYQEESLLDGIDYDALNLLFICLRRAYNAKWTGDIKPSDIFGEEWKEEKVAKEEE